MAKFYGAIGYSEGVAEIRPGVWKDRVVERMYCGDLVRNTRKLQASGHLNDDINIANELSILADPYALSNFHTIRYVEFMGTRWKVSDVEVQYPRLILTLGGVYNGEEA